MISPGSSDSYLDWTFDLQKTRKREREKGTKRGSLLSALINEDEPS